MSNSLLAQHLALIAAHQPPANRALVHARPALQAEPGPGELPWLYARGGLTDWIDNPGLGATDMTYISTMDTPDEFSGLGGFGRTSTFSRLSSLRSRTPSSSGPVTAPATQSSQTAKATSGTRTPTTRRTRTTSRTSSTAKAKAAAQAAARAKSSASAKAKAAAKTRARATARRKATSKRKGPPPWANASFMRDADSKVARAMPPGVKKLIDSLPLSSDKKGKLKGAPVSFLVNLAKSDPQGVSDFIRSARARGAAVAPPAAGENPASLATKLVMAASSASAAAKAATEQAMSGYLGTIVPSTTRLSFVGLAPAIKALSPITLPALKSITSGRTVSMPTKAAITAAGASVTTAVQMADSVPPEATATAEAVAAEEDKVFGVSKKALMYGGGGLALLLIGSRLLKRKK